MKYFAGAALAALLSISTGTVQAASSTLDALVGGGSLIEQDMKFDGFTFTNFGSLAVAASEITVSTSSTANSVTLDFATSLGVDANSFLEIGGAFNSMVVAPSTRTVVGTTLELLGYSLSPDSPATDPFAFVEVQQDDAANNVINEVSANTNGGLTLSDGEVLASLTNFTTPWNAAAEAEGGATTATLSRWSITFAMDGTIVPPGTIPLPAGLPLMISAFAGLGLVGFRRRRRA